MVDVSMFDGALSGWRSWPAKYLADGEAPRRGGIELAGRLICYRPYACKDGWVTLGALEPKFWQAWCRGVDREDLIEKQFEAPGSDAHAEVERIFLERTREEWREFASLHDCCLEPLLELDRRSTRARAARRWSSSSSSPAPPGSSSSACRSSCRGRQAARRARGQCSASTRSGC